MYGPCFVLQYLVSFLVLQSSQLGRECCLFNCHEWIQKILSDGVQLCGFVFVFFSLIRGERIKIPIKAGHYRPASEKPFKWRFEGGQIMAQHCWLGSFVMFVMGGGGGGF